MALAAGVDRCRKGGQSIRYKEYAFILCCGLVGCAVGAANDCVTSRLSPEYFTVGKGLDSAGIAAVLLGAKAGFSAGVIGGAICLFACAKERPPFARMLRLLVIPVQSAILGGPAAGLCLSRFDPMNWATELASLMTPQQIAQFRLVWWIHTGLYSGFAIGLAVMIWRIRQAVQKNRAI